MPTRIDWPHNREWLKVVEDEVANLLGLPAHLTGRAAELIENISTYLLMAAVSNSQEDAV